MTDPTPRNLLRQAREIEAQRRLPPGSEGHLRLWEEITSPYSAKVRVYLHHRGIPYRRMRVTFPDYLGTIPGLVGMPIIPVVLTPDDRVMQDSTPILEWLEAHREGPATVPPDPRTAFLHWLVEDFADEYLPRIAMHWRWGNELNRETVSHRIARRMTYGDPSADVAFGARMVLARQSGYDLHLGLTDATRPDLEAQLLLLLGILEAHFAEWPFLFGDRPSIADFALYGPLFAHLWMDPASSPVMEVHGPRTCHWMETLTSLGDPRGAVGQAEFGDWMDPGAPLPASLGWLLQLIASTWLPLGAATARASVARERTFTATLRGIEATFSTHHYRAWAFEQVQLRWQALPEPHRASLRPSLEEAGILPSLLADGILHNALFDGFTPPFVVGGVADARIRHQKDKADRPG